MIFFVPIRVLFALYFSCVIIFYDRNNLMTCR